MTTVADLSFTKDFPDHILPPSPLDSDLNFKAHSDYYGPGPSNPISVYHADLWKRPAGLRHNAEGANLQTPDRGRVARTRDRSMSTLIR